MSNIFLTLLLSSAVTGQVPNPPPQAPMNSA